MGEICGERSFTGEASVLKYNRKFKDVKYQKLVKWRVQDRKVTHPSSSTKPFANLDRINPFDMIFGQQYFIDPCSACFH